MFDSMYPMPIRVVINNQPVECDVWVHNDQMTKTHVVHLDIPGWDAAVRLLAEIREAPSLDYVINHWSRS